MKDKKKKEVELIKSEEVKSILKISTTTLWLFVKKGTLKSYRIGEHTIRFKKHEVMESIKPYSKE
jgi:predicted DNA-binding transcriptional regulator AlpA